MQFNPDKCPTCGTDIEATQDTVPGNARVFRTEKGDYEYSGSTDVDWNGQMHQRTEDGQVWVFCQNGHQFTVSTDEEGLA
jgi:hypothetical protein